MRHAAKLDGNHKATVKELRARGYRVFDTSRHGEGFPDVVIALKNGRVALLFELKPETGGEVTQDECNFMMKIVEPVYRIATGAGQIDAILDRIERTAE
jgi:hypothetical protein